MVTEPTLLEIVDWHYKNRLELAAAELKLAKIELALKDAELKLARAKETLDLFTPHEN